MTLHQRQAPARGPQQPCRPAVEQLEDRLTPALVGNDLLVDSLYQHLLGRNSDDAGRTFFVDLLNQGVAWGTVVKDVVMSQEFLERSVTRAYQQILKRDPDSGGLAYWTEFLKNGHTYQQLQVQLATSDEEYNSDRGLSDVPWQELLYHHAAPYASDNDRYARTLTYVLFGSLIRDRLTYFKSELDAGRSRAEVVQEMMDSELWRQNRVQMNYLLTLNRWPEVSGRDYWCEQIASGMPEFEVIAALASSPEYLARHS